MSDEQMPTTDSAPEATQPTRRTMLYRIGQGLMAIGGLFIAAPVISYILDPGFRRFKRSWIDLGPVAQFPKGHIRFAHYNNPNPAPTDGDLSKIPCWVSHRTDGSFQVFYINCAHLGCPVRWFEQSRLFMCPCHGGVYYEDGSRASGPPPRGLYEYSNQVKGGHLYVFGGEIPNLSIPGKTPKDELTPLTVNGGEVSA
ncbi:MAG: Rieske 2Fe-2S domain-containing protein [Phycisphaerales bacterium]|nr:Rieske 2Fe-2S domain-containing protein [Phycisphaerales bacterium]